jgi:hypothetical protein
MGCGCIVLYFIEGIIKTIFEGYPLTEMIAGQGAIVVAYMAIRLVQNRGNNK